MNSNRAPLNPYIVLGIAVITASFASTFIRLTQQAGMESLALATIRLTVATIVFTPIALRRGKGEFGTLTRREWVLIAIAGFFLAMHFTTFITSLEYTSILNNQAFNATTPIFAAILGLIFLREQVPRIVVMGIGLSMVGAVIVALFAEAGAPSTRPAPLLGNGLSAAAAFFLGSYFTVGRFIRGKINWLTYSWMVFGFASLTFFIMNAVLGTQLLGYTWEAYFWALMVTVFAQMITHNAFNYALGTLPGATVGLSNMLIPVGASIVAWVILRENPGIVSVIGSAIILAGVVLANLGRQK